MKCDAQSRGHISSAAVVFHSNELSPIVKINPSIYHPSSPPLVHPSLHSSIHPKRNYSFILPSIHPYIQNPLIHSFFHPPIHTSTHPSIHLYSKSEADSDVPLDECVFKLVGVRACVRRPVCPAEGRVLTQRRSRSFERWKRKDAFIKAQAEASLGWLRPLINTSALRCGFLRSGSPVGRFCKAAWQYVHLHL